MYQKVIYTITFGTENLVPYEVPKDSNKKEINANNVIIGRQFEFIDYDLSSTIGHVKEYYLKTFGQKSKFCKCTLFMYFKTSNIYHLLSRKDSSRLSEYGLYKLYLIKINSECNCEFKLYTKYMKMHTFDLIKEFKNKIEQLEGEINNLKKEEEIKSQNKPFENFYDIIIDINLILLGKSVQKDGKLNIVKKA